MYWNDTTPDADVYTYEYFLQENVCRLCWNNNDTCSDIVQKNFLNSTDISLVKIIKDCLDINLDNIIPNKLCERCKEELVRFYSYRKCCLEANEKLQEIILKGPTNVENKLNTVKNDVKEENFDDLMYDDEFEDTKSDKRLKINSKVRKKLINTRSPTYCRICCIELLNTEELSVHNVEFHGIENNGTIFKCFGCEKRFKSRKTRISHESNFCKGLKDGYKCNLCDRYLPKRCTYEHHMRDHRHNTLTELPEHIFKCCKCLQLFKTNELLKIHMLEHGKEKNYVCDTCGRVFTRQDYLHKHKLTHSGTKRHQCPHCDFKATQRSSLTVHIRTHTGERPYSCDLCPQRCVSSSNLRAHRRRHLGVKKFECAICTKKFGYKTSLAEHISITHVRSEFHQCEHCGATYTRPRGLQRHLAAKHGKQAKSKTVDQKILLAVAGDAGNEIRILNNVDFDIKDSKNVLLLKHHDGEMYMV